MRLMTATIILAVCVAAAVAGEGSRTMSGWFNVTTPDGWVGRRYMDGNDIFAEEFDSNGDGRIDVWRFYRWGILSSEERALGANGKVNYQSRWEPRDRHLLSVFRDTRWIGVNDLEIESTGRSRWEVREDRNQDGVADRILILNGPPDLFEQLGMDLPQQTNIIDSIPMEYWYELQSDDTYSCAITDYRRYKNGVLVQYGQWDGRKVAWQRVGPDFTPPPLATSPLPPAPRTAVTGPDATGQFPDGQTGAEAYEPYVDPSMQASEPDLYLEPAGEFRPPTDRTRYEGLPPGDSAARSLPARMRPPGR